MNVNFCPVCGCKEVEFICDETIGLIPVFFCNHCHKAFSAFDSDRLCSIWVNFNEQFKRLIMKFGD